MTFSFEGYVIVVGLVGVSFWLMIGLARLNNTWKMSQMETSALRQQKADDAKLLLAQVEEISRLDSELKDARKRGNMVTQANEIRKDNLANLPPTQPPSIYVSSEFPPSAKDRPWRAQIRRINGQKSRRADEPGERHVLIWGQDQTIAQSRAQAALGAHPGYVADAATKFF